MVIYLDKSIENKMFAPSSVEGAPASLSYVDNTYKHKILKRGVGVYKEELT